MWLFFDWDVQLLLDFAHWTACVYIWSYAIIEKHENFGAKDPGESIVIFPFLSTDMVFFTLEMLCTKNQLLTNPCLSSVDFDLKSIVIYLFIWHLMHLKHLIFGLLIIYYGFPWFFTFIHIPFLSSTPHPFLKFWGSVVIEYLW